MEDQREAEMRLAQKAREADMLRQKEEEECVRRQAKEKEQQRRVEEFLHANGFVALDHAKRVQDAWFLPFRARSVYPIHVAAELGDAGMVEMLIQEGADPAQRTSNGKMASQLARKRNKGGSHDAVLRVLSSKAAPCGDSAAEAYKKERERLFVFGASISGRARVANFRSVMRRLDRSTGAPESLSFHSQSSEVYRPTVSDLDLHDRATAGGGHLVPLGSGHEAIGGKLATTEADTVSLRQAPGGVMDSAGPAAGGAPTSNNLRGFGSMLASAAAGSEEGAAGVQGWAGSMLSYAQQMFDVSSEDVVKRLKLALVPFQGLDAAAPDFRTRPDFYGPFWVATTAVLFLAATGNFARLLETEDETTFKSDYSLVSVAASMVYGLLVGVPLATRLGLYCSGQSVDSINFKQVICVYGYSLTPMIPMSVICLIPLSIFRWLAVLAGLGISLVFLWGTLSADLAVEVLLKASSDCIVVDAWTASTNKYPPSGSMYLVRAGT
ncbi:YIPF1 [Symbiodinium sp. CCMP2456]|nr:YIPF1 [Symbiodinium sp. CCMP2456]